MKVLLYSAAKKLFGISGLGRAAEHQRKALGANDIPFTEDINESYDVVHINTYTAGSKRLAKRAKKQGRAVVYHAHSTEEDFRNSFILSNAAAPLFRKWITSCYNTGDVIITPTEYSKRLLLSYGIKKPIFAISNGVEASFYLAGKADRAEFREKYGFSGDDKIIMSVGLYFERKGLIDFVEMAKQMPYYKFIWFGKTPLHTVPRKIRKAAKTKLPNLVFAGYVPAAELKKAYIGADAFAFMSYEETEGIVLLEALAAGQNVIVRDIPCFDWLSDRVNVYKAASQQEFYMIIQNLLSFRSLPELREEGRKAVADKSMEIIGKRLCEAYNEALNISAQKPRPRG